MSRQFRYRMAAVVLSGLIFGVPLLTNGTASAEQLEPADRQVSFGGGVLGLSCESRPSVESMTVPADTIVRVVNRTGHDAQLHLGSTPRGVVPEDGSADLVFRRGVTAVLLDPNCDENDEVVPMLVTTEPSDPATQPGPDATSAASTMVAEPSGPGSPAGSRAGSALPDSASPASRPSRITPGARRSSVRKAAARPAVTTPDAPSVRPRLKVKTMRGTGIGAPAFAGMPPGDRVPATLASSSSASSVLSSAPALAAAPEVASAGGTSVGGTIAEPVAAVGPIREGRPIGLLGLTALICVLGVSTAAIRAIVSQRASRTNMA
ncbi:hypothetical protein AB0M02_30510 [Actinoplanes sp. NPDC051861]|uniref:hypothetical protein n=1 Tax=Actinoplanes sp. NPDC051861 TaxID=3155170 RepID=UPI00342DF6D7